MRLLKSAGFSNHSDMSEPVAPLILIPLLSAVVLLVLLIAMVFAIFRKLARIEVFLKKGGERGEPPALAPSSAETSPGGAFETFLNEDSTRRKMPKGEQFAAYREWRKKNGMNWSNS